jgi:enoyl-CoA hydratase/carnithine racemase
MSSLSMPYRTDLFDFDKPVICKVHGYCVAGGTDMALCCDLIVIGEDARIGYPPVRAWGVRPRPCRRPGSATSARSGCSSPAT